MSCRIGITTDPETRKAFWELKQVTMSDWQILESHESKADAQARETELAEKYECEAHAGGAVSDNPNARWHVYYFKY